MELIGKWQVVLEKVVFIGSNCGVCLDSRNRKQVKSGC